MTSRSEATDGTLAIRVDASATIGTGHLMRCLALAQAWQDRGGDVVFLCQPLPEALERRVIDEGFTVELLDAVAGTVDDARLTATHVAKLGACALVIDGYAFRDEFLDSLRDTKSEIRILLVDDWGQSAEFPVDLVLNQNTPPWPQSYELNGAAALLGTDFVLLRREFRDAERGGGSRDQILVTFGGSDVLNLGPSVSSALADIGPVTVVVGAAANTYDELCRLAELRPEITVLSNVTDMPSVMQQARVAVSAAGSTSWELCYFGVATVSVPVARNQLPIADFLDEHGAALRVIPDESVAEHCASIVQQLWTDVVLREEMEQRASRLVDGLGAARVVERLLGVDAT